MSSPISCADTHESGDIRTSTHVCTPVGCCNWCSDTLLAAWSHTTLKQFAPSLHHTYTHTNRQWLSICELRREAMKVCNDATWQPIKPERDEDAIRLSSTLELLPTEQMEGAKRKGVYFWRVRSHFRVSGSFLCRHLTWYQVIERWWLLCVISCVAVRLLAPGWFSRWVKRTSWR